MNPEFHYFYKAVDEYIARQQQQTAAAATEAKAAPPSPPPAVSSPTAGKKKWDFPVSRPFYSRLRDNIDRIFSNLRITEPAMPQQVIVLVNNYLLNGCVPQMPCSEKSMVIYTVFFSILHEIDAAMKRSADCRRRAAERRQRREAEKAAAETAATPEAPAAGPSPGERTRLSAGATHRYRAIAPSPLRPTLKRGRIIEEAPCGKQTEKPGDDTNKRVVCISADHPPPV